MRFHPFAAAALALAVAGPASAQLDPYRRFTTAPNDTNRNNKLVYVPLGWSFPGAKPADQPYDVATAAWYRQPLGSTGAAPDKVLDKSSYTLERFDLVRADGGRLMRVVVTQRPAPAERQPPMLRVMNPQSMISASSVAGIEDLPDGVRYTFLVRPPHHDFIPAGERVAATAPRDYELRFMPARNVELPRYIVGAPTFNRGLDPETRAAMPPPRLPVEERVAGKRIEYRSGRVVEPRRR
jgi:hypothetical protein